MAFLESELGLGLAFVWFDRLFSYD